MARAVSRARETTSASKIQSSTNAMIGKHRPRVRSRSSAAIRWHNSIASNTFAGLKCDTCLR